jgi:hypothetical protein
MNGRKWRRYAVKLVPNSPPRSRVRSSSSCVGLGQAAHALVDLCRLHAGKRQPQRVLPAVLEEVGALHEHHAAVARGLEQHVHVRALRQLDPEEIAALRGHETRLGQLALERLAEGVAPLV